MLFRSGYPIIYQAARNSVGNSDWQPVGSIAVPNTEVEQADIFTGGFAPSLIQRPAGLFLLIARNRTNLSSNTLSMGGANLQGDGNVGSFIGVSGDILIDLPPGTYTLALTSNPSWTPLQIVIR